MVLRQEFHQGVDHQTPVNKDTTLYGMRCKDERNARRGTQGIPEQDLRMEGNGFESSQVGCINPERALGISDFESCQVIPSRFENRDQCGLHLGSIVNALLRWNAHQCFESNRRQCCLEMTDRVQCLHDLLGSEPKGKKRRDHCPN